MILGLNGRWQLNSADNKFSCSANVPTSDFCALVENGLIADPLFSGVEQEAIETAKNDFVFSRNFVVDAQMLEHKYAYLECDKLDTLCTCYINGTKAFESKNSYVNIDIDVKQFLVEGENSIEFHFASSYNYITQEYAKNKLLPNGNGVDGIPYIRKPGCHFGWDWGPCVPFNYVGNTNIVFTNGKIQNVKITQKLEDDVAYVNVSGDNIKNCHIVAPNGEIINSDDMNFVINNPSLWYTHDLNQLDSQPLYQVVMSNDEMMVTKNIGIRTIRLNRDKDEHGSNFCFEINGVPIFAKGANLIPFSAMTHNIDNATVDYYLDLAIKGGFNIIRVWGGGSYADEYLLNRCDELGILIWQDFCFACQMYPFYDNDFVANVLDEVKANVPRMSMHPSLCLWCGNNEIETMYSYLPKTHKLVKCYTEFFYKTLPDYIKDLTDIDYIPTSPIGDAPFKNCSADGVGDTHMWNVWHGLKNLKYYQTRYSRFLSEYGLESLPSMSSIKTFATKKEDYDLASKAFMSHQKCIGGNEKMMFYLTEMFDFPKSFEDVPYLTGVVQAECVKNATEHFRRYRGRCNGSIFWQFNDVWNAPSWSAVDFLGVPKALMYKASKFNAPVCLTYDGEQIFAHNDTLFEKQFDVAINVYRGDKVILSKTDSVTVAPTSVAIIGSLQISRGDILCLSFDDNQFIYCDKAKLKKANITTKVSGNTVTLESDTFAKDVMIDFDGVASDNYFCLLPNQPKQITLDKPIDNVNIKCANNIQFKSAKLKKFLFRFFYRLKPMNIANAFYYQFN